jgi:type IV pilus assembly protein PilV
LQLSSLRANNSALSRSQATFLAYDIADRMRANRAAALNKAYDIDFGEQTATKPATVAEHDLQDWLARISATLGTNAQAQVQFLGNSMVSVSLMWNDARGDTLNTTNGAMSTATTTSNFEMRVRI